MRETKPDLSNINLHRLPPQLRLLVRLLGESQAFRLVEQLGGSYVVVPQRFVPEHQLLHVLTVPSVMALIEAYGGTTLQLPKADALLRQVRHQRVIELLDQGYLLREVALQTNYTIRQIINIKQGADPVGNQMDMWAMFGDDEGVEVLDDTAQVGDQMPTAHNPFGL